jgi:hypothetical protein
MRTFLLFALVGLGTFAGGCAGDDESTGQKGCGLTTAAATAGEWYPSLNLSDDGNEWVCDARVVVRDGDFEAILSNDSSACGFYQMPERPGTYDLTIEKGGYVTKLERAVTSEPRVMSCAGPPSFDVQLEATAAACGASVVPSLKIELVNYREAAVCEALVLAREGDFERELTPTMTADGGCLWGGLDERPGTYEITISKPGFQDEVRKNVVVTADACHVKTTELRVKIFGEPLANQAR